MKNSIEVKPIAWLTDRPERYEVIHAEAKALWLKVRPQQVEDYTIPLYRHEPLSTESARAILNETIGIDPMLDGNMLKLVRAIERAHGIGPKS